MHLAVANRPYGARERNRTVSICLEGRGINHYTTRALAATTGIEPASSSVTRKCVNHYATWLLKGSAFFFCAQHFLYLNPSVRIFIKVASNTSCSCKYIISYLQQNETNYSPICFNNAIALSAISFLVYGVISAPCFLHSQKQKLHSHKAPFWTWQSSVHKHPSSRSKCLSFVELNSFAASNPPHNDSFIILMMLFPIS